MHACRGSRTGYREKIKKKIVGECQTFWGEREQAVHYCYVAKALPVKYQITAHWPQDFIQREGGGGAWNFPPPEILKLSMVIIILAI